MLHEPASEKEFPNGVRDRGRNGERLADFVSHPIATAHGLDEPRVAALRLYTTAAYSHINNPLRAGDRHPLPVTVAFIADGIKKLRAKRAEGAGATSTLTLWRGMRNLKIADDFLTERRGGTELAPCSTTTDIAVAAQYSASAESLLFKFRIANFMQFGAELRGSPPSRRRRRSSSRRSRICSRRAASSARASARPTSRSSRWSPT